MSRVFPYPLLSVALAAFWLLINNSLSPLTVAGAALAGLIGPWTLAPLKAPRLQIRKFSTLMKLAGVVVTDIVRSNFAVAAIILNGAKRERIAGFVAVPLDLTNPYGLALLAVIITSTPGTLWAQHDAAAKRLLLHVFDLVDDADWIALVKHRYEPL